MDEKKKLGLWVFLLWQSQRISKCTERECERERERERVRERLRMNESKRRGFLEGTLMEHNMNFFFFLSFCFGFRPCLESWFRKKKKKKHDSAKDQRRKKWKRNLIFLSNCKKFIVLGLFFNRFLVYLSPWCPFFNYILLKFKT